MLPHIISFAIGYIIGSFPAAYFVVKRKTNQDIRKIGGGNVGAMNAFEVTDSKIVGSLVFFIDALKGIISVIITMMLFGKDFAVLSTSGVAAVFGHNYPVWLKFKGGRGLSTTAGVMFVLGWLFVVVWCSLWAVCHLISRHIHMSNIVASVISPVVIVALPAGFVSATLPSYSETNGFLYLVIILCCLILIRHVEPIKELISSYC